MDFSIGMALVDARDKELVVDLLVDGQWLNGVVRAVDGSGVLLQREDAIHSVVRIESIAAVKVHPPVLGGSRVPPRQRIASR